MKFYWKIFFSFFILITITFTISGTWMIYAQFQASMEREIEVGNSCNEMYRTTLHNAVELLPKKYSAKQNKYMKQIMHSLQESMEEGKGSFLVYDEEKKQIYASEKRTEDSSLLEKVDHKHKAYEICSDEGKYYLRTVSYMMTTVNLKGYYIETQTDLGEVFAQRQDTTQRYRYIICIVLLIGAVLSLIISWLLTYRVRGLSAATGEFANGNMEKRVKIRGGDEIAELGADFNRMADELQKKMQELQEHAESQEAFTAAFAHELKTPLTSIIGYAEMIRSMSLSQEEEMMAADYIFSEGKRLETLSYKLLHLFLLQNEEIELPQMSAENLGEEVEKVLAPVLRKKQVKFTYEMQEGYIRGNKELVLSLLTNLVENACKASEYGQQIQMQGNMTEDGYCIRIQDEGKGIPESELENVIKPFYMVDKSRSRKEGGAGLGMTICAEIVRVHQASWKIQSVENRGTTITIQFPKEVES